MKVAVALGLAIVFAAMGDIFLSKGMRAGGEVSLSGFRDVPALVRRVFGSRFVLIGAFCMAGHLFTYAASLAWVDVSVANPLTALSYVIATAYVALVIREKVVPDRWTGVMLITIGAILVGFSS